MTHVPTWFLGADIIFDVVFALVAGLVAWRGWRTYGFFHEARYRTFSAGFALVALSHFVRGIADFFILAHEHPNIHFPFERLVNMAYFIENVLDVRALLFLAGLALLVITYLRITERTTQVLLVLLVLFAFGLSGDSGSMYYVLAALLLLFITFKVGQKWKKTHNRTTALVLCGFILIILGRVLFAALHLSPLFYVLGHIATLIGYCAILASMVRA